MSDHFLVVTGGPGAGKTSLITELARRGFYTIPESGRAIIRKEIASGGGALPWGIAWPMPSDWPAAGSVDTKIRP
ncbi:AAA family ATPase [Acuticoccus sp. MNP-M23]|uniref:AAA family ATPase n=1 Tax=Acuticoccus sp. MNP-M23 TaxID=3072793 RepID=UPI002815FC5A|nr:AAA family ATPase [Acuticoccus sp. MNP-M23]WMS43739.1 AAA family ATPase [Acuticoccus sp. MNP-M23]